MAVNLVVIYGAFQLLEWLDKPNLKLPNWLETVVALSLVLALFSFLMTAAAAGADLTAHLMRDGKVRRLLLKGNQTPQEIAEDFAKTGYWFALAPLALAGVAVIISLAVVVVVGGYLLAAGAVSSIFSGWPSWAIVITILLILVLAKK
jgi:hypothetical protein